MSIDFRGAGDSQKIHTCKLTTINTKLHCVSKKHPRHFRL